MHTLQNIITAYSVDVLDHLDRQATIPVLTGPQIQGDVAILPITAAAASTPIPASGVAVIRGESGGHTHSLHGAGHYDPAGQRRGLTLGTLTVPDGGEVFLLHPEHGGMGVGPGTYRIGRQREWVGEWRTVVD